MFKWLKSPATKIDTSAKAYARYVQKLADEALVLEKLRAACDSSACIELDKSVHSLGHPAYEANYEKARVAEKKAVSEIMLPYLRPATNMEYTKWLRGYIARGGKVTHIYDYVCSDMMVAMDDFTLLGLCGASSFDIIVPVGIEVTFTKGVSHNTVYYMDGYKLSGLGGVSLYSDTREHLFGATP